MAKKEPNGSNDPLNEFNEDCNQSNSVVKQVKTEFKQEIKQEFKQEPFEAFEAREQEGINIITNENFDCQSANENLEIEEPNESNDPLNEFNKDSNSVVKQVKREFKQDNPIMVILTAYNDFKR